MLCLITLPPPLLLCAHRYPVVRVAVSASPLQLHLSPCRYQQLMSVVGALTLRTEDGLPGERTSSTSAAPDAPDQPLWLAESELSMRVSVLSWEGVAGTVAKWQSHRWAHVWRGRLYITAHRSDAEVLQSRSYWLGYRVIGLQPAVRQHCTQRWKLWTTFCHPVCCYGAFCCWWLLCYFTPEAHQSALAAAALAPCNAFAGGGWLRQCCCHHAQVTACRGSC